MKPMKYIIAGVFLAYIKMLEWAAYPPEQFHNYGCALPPREYSIGLFIFHMVEWAIMALVVYNFIKYNEQKNTIEDEGELT